MTLYEFIIRAQYDQVFHVYVCNTYDQNIKVGDGTRKDLMNEDECEAISNLMDKVDVWYVCKDGSIVIQLRDENFEKCCVELYDKKYVESWNRFDPGTRPYRYSAEIEQ